MSSYDEPRPPAPAPPPPPVAKPVPRDLPPGKSPFPIVLSVAFAAVLVAAWIAQGSSKRAETAAAPAAPAASAPEPPAAAPETPAAPAAPAAVSAEEVKGLKGEVEALAKKVESMPRVEASPAPDLKPIHEKVEGLAKAIQPAVELPRKVDDVAGKLAESAKTVDSLKAEVETLKGEIASLKDAIKARPEGSETKPATADAAKPAVDAAAMTGAVDLFKAGKYAEARDAFKKLPADDARVLYYTALANGFATNKWMGETEETVLKGVASEKAGLPAKADIDAAFAGLTEAQGKAWLASYRARAK